MGEGKGTLAGHTTVSGCATGNLLLSYLVFPRRSSGLDGLARRARIQHPNFSSRKEAGDVCDCALPVEPPPSRLLKAGLPRKPRERVISSGGDAPSSPGSVGVTMSNRKRVRRDLRPLSSDVGPEDGIDPRFLPRYPGRRGAPGRKSLQLCAQVAHTLAGALAESEDEVLRDLLVREVAAAPDASHLLVTLVAAPSAPGLNPAEVLEHLH